MESKKFETVARILASSRIYLISAGNAAGRRALSAKAQYSLYTLKNGRHGIVLLHREKLLYYLRFYACLPFLRPRRYELLDFLIGWKHAVVAPSIEEFLRVFDSVAVVAVVAGVGAVHEYQHVV